MNKQQYDTLCAASDQPKPDNSFSRRCEIVDREQHIADQKSLGAMEHALQGIASGQMKREEMIKVASRTLGLVQRFCMEAKDNNDAR